MSGSTLLIGCVRRNLAPSCVFKLLQNLLLHARQVFTWVFGLFSLGRHGCVENRRLLTWNAIVLPLLDWNVLIDQRIAACPLLGTAVLLKAAISHLSHVF